jgi:hypothetical protein
VVAAHPARFPFGLRRGAGVVYSTVGADVGRRLARRRGMQFPLAGVICYTSPSAMRLGPTRAAAAADGLEDR